MGIIDPLTGFTFNKKLEYGFKRFKNGMKMSCVPPSHYAARFQGFMNEIFEHKIEK